MSMWPTTFWPEEFWPEGFWDGSSPVPGIPSTDASGAGQLVTLVTIEWASGVARYAIASEDHVVGGDTFIAQAAIAVDVPEVHGGVDPELCRLRMDASLSPAPQMAVGRYYPAWLTVEEVDPSDEDTRRVLFHGRVKRYRGNDGGRAAVALLEVTSVKEMLDVPLGVIADVTCDNTLGGPACKVDLSGSSPVGAVNYREVGTLGLTISGRVVTCDDVAVTGKPDRWWHRGTVTVNGHSITIIDWESGEVFTLARRPPDDWAGASAVFTVGCDGTLSRCQSPFDNVENFNALGIAMLDRHPQLEVSNDT